MRSTTLTLLALMTWPAAASAGFDWGGDCSTGAGEFEQYIPFDGVAYVGDIPSGKLDVRIELFADADLDVQLIDVLSGTEIIAWPAGLLSGPSEECASFDDVTYCYSGYNGDQTAWGLGDEWIEIVGATNRLLEMRAFGYAAGEALVAYEFGAASNCNETGEGSFAQWIPEDGLVEVGVIDAGKVNISIDLLAEDGRDVDVQLIDPATGVALIAWPDGLLSGAAPESLQWGGMLIDYSGYNGVNGDWGHETIDIWGETTRPLVMKAFGYQSGYADVAYEWGGGTGEGCTSDWSCDEGLFCKEDPDGASVGGSCHTADWCSDDYSAAFDCATSEEGGGFGYFSCEQHECVWSGGSYF